MSSQNKQIGKLKKKVNRLRSELQQVNVDHEEFIEKTSKDVDMALTAAYTMKEKFFFLQEQIESLNCQLAAANEKIKEKCFFHQEQIESLNCQLATANEKIKFEMNQLVEAEKLRKKLHNTIMELKGNIRVFCRVRPILREIESKGADKTIISYPINIGYFGCRINLMHNGQNHSFTFDKVFGHEASQDDVFFEISQLVQSALDGYKVCIFAYGQTGSGKTYTMIGKPGTHEHRGLIPRSLEQIFETSQTLIYQGWKCKMQVSMLEIYNETINDLLSQTRCNSTEATHIKKQYTIKHDSVGNTFVPDLTMVDVCSINEVSFLLNQALQSRSVGRTQMNEQSSRSHFVFTLRISRVNDDIEQVQGVLNLVDLAGSERLAKSGSTGDRLKETQAINKSLSCLSDVIFAIAKKEDHVPYRNSKLTYLLQPYLGGDSKTLMFVNISPEASSANESISSLRFADRVNACEIGVPRRHTQMR